MGLEQDMLNEPVSKLPLRPLIKADRSMTVRQAIEAMRKAGLGCVVVVDEAGVPIGKFTERILINLLLHDPGALDREIGDVTAGVWKPIRQDEPIVRLVDALEEHDLRFAVVTDVEGKAVALTGQRGVSEYIADYFPRIVATARVGGKPFTDSREGA